jgi:hypothetical protein
MPPKDSKNHGPGMQLSCFAAPLLGVLFTPLVKRGSIQQ